MSLALKDSILHMQLFHKTEIPKTLDDAVIALDKMIAEDVKEHLKQGQEKAAIELHSSLGRYLRNKWGLWSDSELALHLREVHGINHPDEMSHAVITAYCNSLIK